MSQILLNYEEVKNQHTFLAKDICTNFNNKGEKISWSYSFKINDESIETPFIREMERQIYERANEFEKSIADQLILNLSRVSDIRLVAIAITNDKEQQFKAVPISDFPKLFIEKLTDVVIKARQKKKVVDLETQESINFLYNMNAIVGDSDKFQKKEIYYDLEEILKKISRKGIDSLSTGEKTYLKQQSEKLKK